jgi:hypothetical protein
MSSYEYNNLADVVLDFGISDDGDVCCDPECRCVADMSNADLKLFLSDDFQTKWRKALMEIENLGRQIKVREY